MAKGTGDAPKTRKKTKQAAECATRHMFRAKRGRTVQIKVRPGRTKNRRAAAQQG